MKLNCEINFASEFDGFDDNQYLNNEFNLQNNIQLYFYNYIVKYICIHNNIGFIFQIF